MPRNAFHHFGIKPLPGAELGLRSVHPGDRHSLMERLRTIHRQKTGALIRAAVCMGALAGAAAAVGDAASDIQQALMALGYNEKDAAAALKALPAGVGVSEGIKLALKSLAK